MHINQLKELKNYYVSQNEFEKAARVIEQMKKMLGDKYLYYSHKCLYSCVCSSEQLLSSGCLCGGN